jgi:hypothetical protein
MARTAAATMCMGATLALALGGAQVADARPKPAADEQAQDSGKKAAKPAKVVLSDKAELKDSPSDSATTVKKLHANDKLEFVEYSPDGKWAKVKKSKAEGWLSASVLTGLPPFVAASASTTTAPTGNAQTDKPASSTPAPAPDGCGSANASGNSGSGRASQACERGTTEASPRRSTARGCRQRSTCTHPRIPPTAERLLFERGWWCGTAQLRNVWSHGIGTGSGAV